MNASERPPRTPRPSHQQAALDAYAAPIVADASEHAALVLDGIEADVQAGAGRFSDELATVVTSDEWLADRRAEKLHIPEGALLWAKTIWGDAFERRLSALATERMAERVTQGEAMLRRHLQGREANHELQGALDRGSQAVAAIATGMRSRS